MGIHGEPGVEKIAVQQADGLVSIMTERLSAAMKPAGKYALLINNLGAVPPLEMSLIANAVLSSPFADRVALAIGPGPLMTALNMNGFSLSLIALDPVRETALLSNVAPRAWLPAIAPLSVAIVPAPRAESLAETAVASHDGGAERVLAAICDRLISLEPELNRLDAKAGDGDTGSTVATGARSILAQTGGLPLADRATLFSVIGDTLSTAMGGSSGVLLSIFFTAAGRASGDGGALSCPCSPGSSG